jgi:hypothetical protein
MRGNTWSTKGVLLIVALAFACAAQALSLHRDGDDLYASGVIQAGDELALRQAAEQGPIRRLILLNSPGGALMASLRMARWLEGLRITTVAAGHCLSACSILFMAGHERVYAQLPAGQATVVGIHGAYHARSGQISQAAVPVMLSYYRARMGAHYEAAVIEQALQHMKDPSGFLMVPAMQGTASSEPWHCPSAQASRHECTVHTRQSALSLGVVTQAASVSLPSQALALAHQAASSLGVASGLTARSQPLEPAALGQLGH